MQTPQSDVMYYSLRARMVQSTSPNISSPCVCCVCAGSCSYDRDLCVCALCLRLCGMLCDVWCNVGGFVCLCVGMLVCEFVYHWVGIGLSG